MNFQLSSKVSWVTVFRVSNIWILLSNLGHIYRICYPYMIRRPAEWFMNINPWLSRSVSNGSFLCLLFSIHLWWGFWNNWFSLFNTFACLYLRVIFFDFSLLWRSCCPCRDIRTWSNPKSFSFSICSPFLSFMQIFNILFTNTNIFPLYFHVGKGSLIFFR